MTNDERWLFFVKDEFDARGAGGGDFYYLLQTMLKEEEQTFPQLVFDASSGCGCTVHEGLSYSLDQDWDCPDLFDEVVFFIGDIESSKLSIGEYVDLIKASSDAYCFYFQSDLGAVMKNVERLICRYKK
ncbi:hypothetical protein RBA41_26065 [Massilia sp. CCM 9210]|uniref:hypothetical protein n=1 Tax=Massilia scottii TaxID=3057166 RepID=UPI0027967E45|nr:hypothetical protein [Massilia sp. CCM 9210]MDQ1816773.1 hypothetical protein [Massilia sp. CCM 9210]